VGRPILERDDQSAGDDGAELVAAVSCVPKAGEVVGEDSLRSRAAVLSAGSAGVGEGAGSARRRNPLLAATLFRQGSFMARLAQGSRDDLLARGERRRFAPGDNLVMQGDKASHLFVLVDGLVKVTVVAEGGEPALLAVRASGDLIGELAMISDGRRSATVTAARPVVAERIFAADFRAVLHAHPDAVDAFTRSLAAKLRGSVDSRSGQQGPARVRLARLLVRLVEQYGWPSAGALLIDLPLSQVDLGNLIGAGEPTVHKAVSELKRGGLLEVRGHRSYAVRDLAGLCVVAGGAEH
jgi:CRP-like cAMP-binding protein